MVVVWSIGRCNMGRLRWMKALWWAQRALQACVIDLCLRLLNVSKATDLNVTVTVTLLLH